jgi:hypothetical protein
VKRAHHQTAWRSSSTGDLVGIDFGYEFAAEHEIGISGIREAFGIKTFAGNQALNKIKRKIFGEIKPVLGIDARIIKTIPITLQHKIKGDFTGIYYSSATSFSDSIFQDGIKQLSWEMSKPNGKDLVTFWGDNSFMIVSTNTAHMASLKKAFHELNIVIMTGKAGLCFLLKDKIDDRLKTELYASDLNAWELRKKSDEIGIEKELISAKKEFYALRPNWKNIQTKEIHFWLNPVDQKSFEAGWYTADELREWIKGTGPVVKEITIKK